MRYITIPFRRIKKNGYPVLFSALGLCIGIVAVTIILLFIDFELSYDKFFDNYSNIYRVSKKVTLSDKETNLALTEGSLATFMRTSVSGIKNVTVALKNQDELLFENGEKSFLEKKGFLVDSSFLEVIEFPFIHGDAMSSLDQPSSIVMTEEFAIKCFGKGDVIGSIISFKRSSQELATLKVTGVLKNIPENSSLKFDFLITGSTFPFWEFLLSHGSPFYTFYSTTENASEEQIQNSILNFEKQINIAREYKIKYQTQRLSEAHFSSGLLFDFTKPSNKQYIYLLFYLTIFLFVVIFFNFLNLLTTVSVGRVNNFVVRRIFGSSWREMTAFNFIEALIYLSFSFVVSLTLAEVILNFYMGQVLGFSTNVLQHKLVLGLLICFGLIIAIISALYPIHVLLKKVKLVDALKGNLKLNKERSLSLKNLLVICQFVLVGSFITWAVLISRQVSFMKNKDLGLNEENIISVHYSSTIEQYKWREFKGRLESHGIIQNGVAGSQYQIFESFNASILKLNDGDALNVFWNRIDFNFIPLFGINVVEGRNFSNEIVSDTAAIILNQTAFDALENSIDNLGRSRIIFPIISDNLPVKVLGVVEDFHIESFSNKIPPIVFCLNDKFSPVIYVKLTDSFNLDFVIDTWEKVGINTPFEFKSLSDSALQFSSKEDRLRKIAIGFAGVSATLMLITLTSFLLHTLNKSRRTFAIKRVLGGTFANIFWEYLTGHLMKLGLSAVVALPLVVFLSRTWLEGFVYRVDFSYLDFLVAFMILLSISILIIFIATRAYLKINPARILRE